jgi:predicted DNA-binding transcriptional regulator YafY
MVKLNVADFKKDFPADDNGCLEWLKNRLYPNGTECHVCKQVTRHHKVSKRHCYVCDNCGNHLYPTAGTIFYKSKTPLNIWFRVIRQMLSINHSVSAKEIQSEYGLSSKRAYYMVNSIRGFLDEKDSESVSKFKNKRTGMQIIKSDINKPAKKTIRNLSTLTNSSKFVKASELQGEHINNTHEKSDRIARLLRIQMLLWQNSQGMKIEEVAEKLAVSKKTVYRDLKTLEVKLNVPLWEERGKRGIVEGYFLPPINFTISEAMNIYLAARMMNQLTPEYNLSIISTYMKLSSIAPEPLRGHIQSTIDYLERQPKDERAKSNFEKLTQSWLLRHKIKICYQEISNSEQIAHVIEPYFIEPLPFDHTCVVIGYCHSSKSIKAFKMDQIIGDIIIEPGTFIIPSDFNPIEYLYSGWGFQYEDQITNVKVQLKSKINKYLPYSSPFIQAAESRDELPKNTQIIVTIKVRDITQFCRWAIRYYDEIKVLEPESLRSQIRKTAEEILNIYPDS